MTSYHKLSKVKKKKKKHHIYYLTVSVGEESRYDLAGSLKATSKVLVRVRFSSDGLTGNGFTSKLNQFLADNM